MSKERLEEIKAHFAYCMDEGLLFSEQEEVLLVDLYEQAERAQELDNELQLTEKSLEGFDKAYEKEKQQNKRYRKVMIKLQDFVKRGEDECNIKQLIMKLTDEALERDE